MTNPRSSPSTRHSLRSRLPLAPLRGMAGDASKRVDNQGDSVGVSPALGFIQGSSFSFPSFKDPSIGPDSQRGSESGGTIAFREESNRGGAPSSYSGLLREDLCSPQILRGLEACSGPFIPEQIPEAATFPYGNSIFGEGFCPQGRFWSLDRSK